VWPGCLGRKLLDVEERLYVLERSCPHAGSGWSGRQTFPDGTLTLRYRFVHVSTRSPVCLAAADAQAAWRVASQSLLDHYGEKGAAAAA